MTPPQWGQSSIPKNILSLEGERHRPPPTEGLWKRLERAWMWGQNLIRASVLPLPIVGPQKSGFLPLHLVYLSICKMGGQQHPLTEPTARGWHILCPKQGSAPAVPWTPSLSPLMGSSLQEETPLVHGESERQPPSSRGRCPGC